VRYFPGLLSLVSTARLLPNFRMLSLLPFLLFRFRFLSFSRLLCHEFYDVGRGCVCVLFVSPT